MTLRPASSTLLVVASPTVTNVVAGGPHSLVEVRQQAGGLKIEKQGDLSKKGRDLLFAQIRSTSTLA